MAIFERLGFVVTGEGPATGDVSDTHAELTDVFMVMPLRQAGARD